MGFIHFAAAFAVVACGAGRYQICPNMSAAHVARNDVIDCQIAFMLAAILAGIIVTPEDFAAC